MSETQPDPFPNSESITRRIKTNGKYFVTGEQITASSSIEPTSARQSKDWTNIVRVQIDVDEGEVPPKPRRLEPTSIWALYNLDSDTSPTLKNAMALTVESVGYLDEALQATRENEEFQAEDAITRLRRGLVELFACRKLSEGFSEIVRACLTAAMHVGDRTPNEEQLIALQYPLRRLQKEPFMRFEDAIQLVIDMDESGLTVDETNILDLVPISDDTGKSSDDEIGALGALPRDGK